ncbi:shikimate dehydrogenase [Microbacterium capsulatum]|uniref:Shikimate dehydrogenase n=1 Tax=Microbacterium capsulatum TaxID=3041921 RepID=A0ABU0XCD4_9MICO|nr:shikimate dehydrogenase [Microbacterium sp. ASV81]MDQ4212770.1 shikimate dehydrogenase [Microbacterium sp. ASV81]
MRDRPYLVGLVGSGVTPSLTPPMHMVEATHLGLSYVYRPIDMTVLGLDVEDLGATLDWAERLGFDALNVTHPCKQAVLAHLDRVDPIAAALGAVNTVLLTPEGRIGYNTDTTGFERAFRDGMPDAPLDRVVQLGAGGAGSAVADALLRLGAQRLTILDLDAARALALAEDLTARHGVTVLGAAAQTLPAHLAGADGVVHCTPTGMAEHPGLPFAADLLRPDLWVADIVYRPYLTELLATARSVGAPTLDGGRMAVHQAVDAFELITGIHPDPSRMTDHLHRLVADHDAAD